MHVLFLPYECGYPGDVTMLVVPEFFRVLTQSAAQGGRRGEEKGRLFETEFEHMLSIRSV